MGFVRIDNYDGDKGYLPNDTASFTVVERKKVKFLVNFDEVENPPGFAYRIIRESSETAIATKVTNKKLLGALEKKFFSDAEKSAAKDLEDSL
jgi:hypothetical protein